MLVVLQWSEVDGHAVIISETQWLTSNFGLHLHTLYHVNNHCVVYYRLFELEHPTIFRGWRVFKYCKKFFRISILQMLNALSSKCCLTYLNFLSCVFIFLMVYKVILTLGYLRWKLSSNTFLRCGLLSCILQSLIWSLCVLGMKRLLNNKNNRSLICCSLRWLLTRKCTACVFWGKQTKSKMNLNQHAKNF